jgi:hypothetical protein
MATTLIAPGGGRLPGDWRRRFGSKTDAHQYTKPDGTPFSGTMSELRPDCGKAIPRKVTERAPDKATPCYDCLVEGIRRAANRKAGNS